MKMTLHQLCTLVVILFAGLQLANADEGAVKNNRIEATPSRQTSTAVDEIVRSYYAEREHLISTSLSRADQNNDFAYQLVKERQLLEELRKPSNQRTKLLLVLHAKARSIATVSETIANEQVKRDPLAASFVASYKKRLEQLRQEAAALESAME